MSDQDYPFRNLSDRRPPRRSTKTLLNELHRLRVALGNERKLSRPLKRKVKALMAQTEALSRKLESANAELTSKQTLTYRQSLTDTQVLYACEECGALPGWPCMTASDNPMPRRDGPRFHHVRGRTAPCDDRWCEDCREYLASPEEE